MNLAKKLLMTTGTPSGGPSGGYVDDVFSSYVRRGNGASDTVISGQDLANDGGMVWLKGRSGTYDHYLFHTGRGTDIFLSTNNANGQGALTAGTSLKSFNNNGFTLGASPYVNDSATDFVAWVFRNSPRFYGHQVVSKVAGTSKTVNFPELGTLGMVRVKRTDQPGSWYVWHRSLPAGQLLIGETNAAAATLGHVTVAGTTVTLNNGVIADGQYLVEAFAHDTSTDGIIQCGSFTTDGSGGATVNLGWESQYLLVKRAANGGDWFVFDTMRGLSYSKTAYLTPNASSAENFNSSYNIAPTANGFTTANFFGGSSTYIYLAIRRPNKPPKTGAEVYNSSTASGVVSAGFPVDLHIGATRTGAASNHAMHARLTGGNRELVTSSTAAEATITDLGFDSMTGLKASLPSGMVNHFFRRAPGFMDEVCDTGTGVAHAIAHNLTKAPELIIRKSRSAATQWEVWHSALAATEKLVLNSNAAKATDTTAWNSTLPTATQFTVGTGANVNANAATFVTHLFATLAGISKVGSYNGNGGTQTIPCGFTTGSRFVLIKRIDNTGDWFVWDTARGITPTTDPHLSLNTNAAEVTTDDSIDQDASGFIVNQNAATNINAGGGSYIFLAIA